MRHDATLYLHFPCFDGVISGVLASDLLEQQGWSFKRFCPVNYDLRAGWASNRLDTPSAVVDFLYHPDAQFWADHHSTTFLSQELRLDYERRKEPRLLYDSAAGSCALLLWRNFSDWFNSKRASYREMVDWADKIDSANYADVREAVFGDTPALVIHRSLIIRSDAEYCGFLIQALRNGSLGEVAKLLEVRDRSNESRALIDAGLASFRGSAHLEGGEIVFFLLDAKPNEIVSRYAPFYFFPRARYSIGLVRGDKSAKITAMRNPWIEFDSVPLGPIFERYGGGGHHRVASVILKDERFGEAEGIVRQLLSEIQRQDTAYFEPLRRALA
ncbi:MAG: hypothetical protein LAN84_11645 [Acidobacteriia bacterium]|nr:hypothetical protein [Terriglobia bacterium]